MLNDETRAEIRRLLSEHTAKSTASPEAARAALVRRGVYTADGRLTAEYGGDGPSRAPEGR